MKLQIRVQYKESNKMYLLHREISKIGKKFFPFHAELTALTAPPECRKVAVGDTLILLRVRLFLLQQKRWNHWVLAFPDDPLFLVVFNPGRYQGQQLLCRYLPWSPITYKPINEISTTV